MSQTRHPFEAIEFTPLPAKPRRTALTSVLDKGLGPAEVEDLLMTSGEWIDVVKLGWGTARMTPGPVLQAKIKLYLQSGIRVCFGGTFLEVAMIQDKVKEFLEAVKSLGVDLVEVSNGVHDLPQNEKCDLIRRITEEGLTVWSEVGKKSETEDSRITIEERISLVESELEAGSEKVILEARESGSIGIYHKSGEPQTELLDRLFQRLSPERLVFEAPQKSQQLWMIRRFGPEVNLGNVACQEAIPLATLRTGLRGDTLPDFQMTTAIDVHTGLGINGALEARERGGVVIVVDALRASSTITTALASGIAAVKLVRSPDECVGEVTAGERGGRKLPTCTHTNSPLEIRRQGYDGETLVMTTTNCAEVLLTAVGPKTQVLVGAACNATATGEAARKLAQSQGLSVTLLMAGRNNKEAIEDSLVAGIISRAIGPMRFLGEPLKTSASLEADFSASESGQNLIALGYSEDVRFCAQTDLWDLVPVYRDGLLVPLEKTE